ncbi:MAG TPA: hypothetical protein VMF61_13455 [Candidatus Acidoferrales bacterium]|nr:hypothetical protein [Candidatus Acidoferrales bacterium]
MASSPKRELERFIDRYSPEIAARARAVLAKIRQRLPGAVELVYDNTNALVVGFGASERASDAAFSVALYPKWINLYFLGGASLPDPHRLLCGSGKVVRRIKLDDPGQLDDPRVIALMNASLARCRPIDPTVNGRIAIRAAVRNRRSRRPGG